MKDVLDRIALGQGQEAERRVKAHYADWLRAHRPSSSAVSSRRRMAVLRELALSAAAIRQEREAFDRGLQRFLVPHAGRAALLRRLTDAGLWTT